MKNISICSDSLSNWAVPLPTSSRSGLTPFRLMGKGLEPALPQQAILFGYSVDLNFHNPLPDEQFVIQLSEEQDNYLVASLQPDAIGHFTLQFNQATRLTLPVSAIARCWKVMTVRANL